MAPVLLITRPQPDADRTAAHLRALDIDCAIAPMLEAKPSGTALPALDAMVATAATSANAIRFLSEQPGFEILRGRPLYTVGDQTAREAELAGFTNVHSAGGTLHDLAHLIAANKPPGPVFYPAAHHQSGDLAGLLSTSGIPVETHVLYEMVAVSAFPPAALKRLMDGEIAGALFYSRRTAVVFARLCEGRDFAPVRTRLEALCISESCAEPLVESHFLRISLADEPNGEAMETLALAFAREQIRP
ncbi:uroporphyrinogen-III synthase [Pelagibacterium xiamenense]|uniref:uroporphyrinogen-III synthase n=1 Tax=Pelagibacterium xiamenense TaxID=2901140 RepID=UPI001E59A12F|nr:uroporphyrinogen-III synthase [Pelagibacterium xiamenense]MCD7058314.1 uroporphyrinogen-III synthase [Pelagibacterium xiamenense]